jgi:hypothetical protein
MGQEKDAEWRRVVFAGYQVNEALMVELVRGEFIRPMPPGRAPNATGLAGTFGPPHGMPR